MLKYLVTESDTKTEEYPGDDEDPDVLSGGAKNRANDEKAGGNQNGWLPTQNSTSSGSSKASN